MVVVGIMTLLMVFAVPTFTNLKRATDAAAAAETIAGTLAQARSDAIATNTYTWIGFYEEATTAASPTSALPPYPGKGRLIMAVVRSLDGTAIFDSGDPAAVIPSGRIAQVGKLVKIDDVHLTDVGPPPSPTPNPTPLPNSLAARPDWPYTFASSGNADHFNRINSDSSDKTQFWFVAQGYTFYKTVRFSPRGEANLNSTYGFKVAAELGIVPMRGSVAPTPPPAGDRYSGNVAAIQFSAVGGNFKVYRQ
jgi:type II secretory pathway pseudopilin PulG